MSIRLIARLDIKGPNLVKGLQMEGLRVLGRPEDFARRYYEDGADELIYMDVVASLFGRNSLNEIIQRTSREIFIPLTVGGGLRSVEDIRGVLLAGADKVAINTAAVQRPELISEAARKFGSSTIVVSIEAKRLADGRYEAFTDNGRERTGRDAVEWATQAESLGAGEIMITSVDREGTGDGMDVDLIRRISDRIKIPLIACGGAGCIEHISAALEEGRADAVGLASMLHYQSAAGPQESRTFTRLKPCSMADIRATLRRNGRHLRDAGAPRPLRAQDAIERPRVAIIDCGVGNLTSISQACELAGLRSFRTQDAHELLAADAAILPGVGAFGDAMDVLDRKDLIPAIHDFIAEGKPLLGICLGMQLLFSESEEFGSAKGLGIFEGRVRRLKSETAKVPNVGWEAVSAPRAGAWSGTLLDGLIDGAAMYFSHSYCVVPDDSGLTVATSPFGASPFGSAVGRANVWGVQFHPERSGLAGLSIYQQLARRARCSPVKSPQLAGR